MSIIRKKMANEEKLEPLIKDSEPSPMDRALRTLEICQKRRDSNRSSTFLTPEDSSLDAAYDAMELAAVKLLEDAHKVPVQMIATNGR